MATKGTYDLLGTGSVRASVKPPASWRKLMIRIKAVRKATWLVRKRKQQNEGTIEGQSKVEVISGGNHLISRARTWPTPSGRAAYRAGGIVE